MNTYIVDGRNIKNIETLCSEFASAVNAPDNYFGKCFQSFDDCLFGGFGLESPCEIIWEHSAESKRLMDSEMLKKYCEDIIENSSFIHEPGHEEGKEWCYSTLTEAKAGARTFFDVIVETIQSVSERATCEHRVDLVLQ